MKNENKILKQLNVLYAEDDEIIRLNTAKTLELFCNKVFQVENGIDALECFKKEPIHIVILDYVMPDMDGNNVAEAIRKVDADIPIFITSSYTEKEKLLNMIGLNIIGYLEKPINFSELMKVLNKCAESLAKNHKIHTWLADGVAYDYIDKNIIADTNIIRLTKNEYKFIEMLLDNNASVVLTQYIEDVIFPNGVDSNTLRNMVYRLRKKIEKDFIVTVKDIGYMLARE